MDRHHIIAREADRLAEVLSTTALNTPVPTCPGWTAEDLLWHLTKVHLFWAGILASGALSNEQVQAVDESLPSRPSSLEELLALRGQATHDLIDQLGQLGDDIPRWTWWGPNQTVGFTRRMQTYEATMHRVDAELTAGEGPSPIDAEVAAGAVEHCADVMWGWKPQWAEVAGVYTVELLSTDTDQHWLIGAGSWSGLHPEKGTMVSGPLAVRATDGAPQATFSGTAEQLALWAWGRGREVASEGDDDAVSAMTAVIDAGIQ